MVRMIFSRMKNVLLSHRIVEMLYHSINNGGCGFLLLWFLFVRKFFGTKPGHHVVTSFTKPGPVCTQWFYND